MSKWFTKPLLARDGLAVSFRPTCVEGSFVAELFWDRAPMPLCTLWLRWEDPQERTTLKILNCYVPESFRRLGLLTWTFEETCRRLRCRFVTTERGTEFSLPWLAKMGFVKHKDHYAYTRTDSTSRSAIAGKLGIGSGSRKRRG